MHWKHKSRQDLKPQWRWSTRKSQCTQNSDSFLWMSLTSALSLSVKPGGLWRVGHYLPIGNSGLEISPNLWNKDKLTLHQHGRQWVCCLLPRCWQDRLEKQASLTSDVLVKKEKSFEIQQYNMINNWKPVSDPVDTSGVLGRHFTRREAMKLTAGGASACH